MYLFALQHVLWKLYCAYVLSDDGISTTVRQLCRSSKGRLLSSQMVSKRMLKFDKLWAMMKDFSLCPTMCKYVKFFDDCNLN
jgi:hypothetical protein